MIRHRIKGRDLTGDGRRIHWHTGNHIVHVKVQQQIQDESAALSLVSSVNLVWI